MKLCSECDRSFIGEGWTCPYCSYAPLQDQGFLAFAPDLLRGDGTDVDYDYEALFRAEAGHFWFAARNALLIWALTKYFPSASKFLEVGCGTGFVASGISEALPTLSVSASDIQIKGLAYARERAPGLDVFQADACRLPFEKEFDVVGAFDMLEHVEADEHILARMFRATKPGGGIILTVPQHPFLWSYIDEFACHKRRYTRVELVSKLERAGFRPLRLTSFVSLLLPAMLVSRYRVRTRPADFDPVSELQINPILNTCFHSMLRVELIAIRSGVSFPMGGSLLAVAQK